LHSSPMSLAWQGLKDQLIPQTRQQTVTTDAYR
jgi:hypothetical protein